MLSLAVTTHGSSGGHQPVLRHYLCRLGARLVYVNYEPLIVAQAAEEPSRVRLRAFAVAPLAEFGCSLSDLDDPRPRIVREGLTGRLGPPGRYDLVLRTSQDVPAWLSIQVHRISVRGARLADATDPDPDRAALRAALVDDDPIAALAAFARVPSPDPRERVWQAHLLLQLGRFAEAEPLWRAILSSDDPAARATLHTLLRGRHADVGRFLRHLSEPRYLALLHEAWSNTAINHLADARVREEFLEILRSLDFATLVPEGADRDLLLRAADLLSWRGRLRSEEADADLARAGELFARAGEDTSWPAILLLLDRASLAAKTGDPRRAREYVRAAREASDMKLLVDDILRARPELAALAPARP